MNEKFTLSIKNGQVAPKCVSANNKTVIKISSFSKRGKVKELFHIKI